MKLLKYSLLVLMFLYSLNFSLANDCFCNPEITTKSAKNISTSIQIDNLWVKPSIWGGGITTLYFTLKNYHDEDDYLVKVEADVAIISDIVESVNINNITKIINVNKVAIPPNVTIKFKPEGIYVLLFGLHKPLIAGSKVNLRFFFEKNLVVEDVAYVIDK